MRHVIEVDSHDTVQNAIVDQYGRISGLSRHKGCNVTIVIRAPALPEKEEAQGEVDNARRD